MPKDQRLKSSRLAFGLALSMLAGPALARLNPTPPPSGIVVHLFGPESITSHVLPTFIGPPSAPAGAAAGTAPAGTATAPNGVNPAAGAPSAAAYPEPTMGQVLHQMFVVGDPSKTPAQILAPGRAAEHPPAANP